MPFTVANANFEFRGDRDWLRAYFEAGRTYVLQIPQTSVGSIYLVLPDGTRYRPAVEYSNLVRFVAPTTGDYFVVADAIGAPGAYQVYAQDYVDPVLASVATTSTIAVGGSFSSGLNSWAGPFHNEDWHQITLTAGTSYALTSNNIVDRVYIADATGNVVAIEAQGQQRTLFTPTTSGTYYAAIQSIASEYTLSLNTVTDDYGASMGQSGALAVGTPTTGSLENAGDDDWFAITLTAGQSYRLLMNTGSDTTPGKALEVRDANGVLLTQTSRNIASSHETIFSAATTGTYYVGATLWGGNTPPGGGIGYTLSATVVSDLADNVTTTGTLAVGGSTNGSWQAPGDRDWYAMTVTAGTSYGVGVIYAGGPAGSPGIAVYDAAGVIVPLENEVTGTTAATHFSARTSGIYYVAALPPSFSSGTIAHTVIAAALADDLPNTPDTTGTVTVSGTATGVAESTGDADWFAVTLTAGLIYRPFSPDGSTSVNIRNAAGALLTQGGGDEIFSPETTGVYYVEAIRGSGAYTVGINQIFNDPGTENVNTGSVLRENFNGTAGPDTLDGVSAAHELFFATDGDDLLLAGNGYDVYSGGNGNDTVSFVNYTSGVDVSLGLGGNFVGGLRRHIISLVENVTGSAFDDIIAGSSATNILDGGNGNDAFSVLGGSDVVRGGAGNDSFSFTTGFSATVTVDGGTGNDQLGLNGAYNALTLGATTLTNVEVLAALPGGGNIYNITTHDANVAAGATFTVFGGNLGTGQNFTVNASAETDGVIITYGGLGIDTITGGTQSDGFYFGPGKWQGSDSVVGGLGGNDQLALDGDYSIGIEASADVETLVLLAGPPGTPNTYNITISDVWTAAGQTKTVFGRQNTLGVTINGAAETAGNFIFFGGRASDTLTGGAGSDQIYGLEGNDAITGGLGSDIAVYQGQRASYSVVTNMGSVQIVDNDAVTDGDDGTDTVVGIEFARFADQTISITSPIILDLDGGGVQTLSAANSNARFDMDGDGIRDDTSWFGRGEGLLFLDRDGNGTLSNAGEMSFTGDVANARSDLEGLAAYDSNDDGQLSKADKRFASFKIWRDRNGDGVVGAGEVMSLNRAGVRSLSVTGTANNARTALGDTAIVNHGSFTRTNGRTGGLVDAVLTAVSSRDASDPSAAAMLATDDPLMAMRSSMAAVDASAHDISFDPRISLMAQDMASFGADRDFSVNEIDRRQRYSATPAEFFIA